VSNQRWRPFLNSLLEPLYKELPLFKDTLPSEAPSITALVFLTVAILIINYFARDTTAMKEHPTPIEKEFPEKGYNRLLDSFSGVLLDDLNRIDRETNWSAEIFTPLDAEVEIKSGSKHLKKVTDLLTAIRSDRRSKVFLVLGDPGSGKSVALRKLCRDLLNEVKRSGRVPLYVNLREWEPGEPWTENNPPTVEHLFNFVFNNLKSRGDVFTNEFMDKYFKKMFENGRLFIILDSFDEIPRVLDVDENSWLIDSLSDVTYRFLAGAHESRGILASRLFRRPTDKFDAKTVLEIRPFTESKIVEFLKKSLFYDESLIALLFNEKQEFVPIARNPFSAGLISSYARDHDNKLPQNQADLYSSYITRRLNACKDRIEKKNLTNEKIEIADVMLSTENLGLEASIKDLKQKISDDSIEDTIDILRYARLGRLGGGDEQRFSFVHRRFNEYFVVQRLKEHPDRIPRDSIPTDSRWRDALVLYCEIADENEATQIAEFCWSEIRKIDQENLDMRGPQYLRSIHCLRFLKEAFRARLNSIEPFRSDLAYSIVRQIETAHNLLSIKLSVEAVGLLEEGEIDTALVKALEINNQWINETALKSCHYLHRLSKELYEKLRLSIENIPILTFLKRRQEIIFSLKLSNIFSDLRKFCIWRTIDCYCLLLGTLWAFVFYPILTILASIVVLLGSLFFEVLIPGGHRLLIRSGNPNLEYCLLRMLTE
jgi:GTPase SAR1 family protein